MRNKKLLKFEKNIILSCLAVMLLSSCKNSDSNYIQKISQISNPIHFSDKEQRNEENYTEYSYIFFGSYPQKIFDDCNFYNQIDANLLMEGKNTGDTKVGGVKYRKIGIDDINDPEYFSYRYEKEYAYFTWEPIRWRVLNIYGNTALIVAEKCLDSQEYNEKLEDVTWETCSLRKWLNGYEGFFDEDRNEGKSFTTESFFNTAFSEDEKKAILQTPLTNDGNDTSDKIFLLSKDDVLNYADFRFDDYSWPTNDYWEALLTDYSVAIGTNVTHRKDNSFLYKDIADLRGDWWLRSQGKLESQAFSVCSQWLTDETNVDDKKGVMPALYINLESDVWSVAK